MHISRARIENFRCLRDTTVPLSHFSTIIGENNCGKSSILQSLILFVKGTKLSPSDFYESGSEIVIDVTLQDVSDSDLTALADEHRERIKALLSNGTLRLVRRYKPDGTSVLRCIRRLPVDQRFHPDRVGVLTKGLSGAALRTAVEEQFPELVGKLTTTTVGAAKALIEQLANSLPPEMMVDQEAELPTGIENSVKALLPDPIYIPAVKELSDDIKTRESASFGKLLSVLLNVIESKLAQTRETFADLNRMLNRVRTDETVADERLGEVRAIENLVQTYVRESFPDVAVEIQIPPPEVKTVLSNAKILINDGVEGLVESKGDGLKRAVTFAILRAYAGLSTKPEWQRERAKDFVSPGKYIFLFEEPELYLHPNAQMVLYQALQEISQEHQVVLTTHSPMFLTPYANGTFMKMVKRAADGKPPFGDVLPLDLADVNVKDQFQLICFDNNNAAFFADTVVLVEGDSDYIALAHIAKTLNAEWDFTKRRTALVRVSGKGSIARYRGFFERFGVRTCVVADLDVLVRDFEKLGLPEHVGRQRSELMQVVDEIIGNEELADSPTGEQVKAILRRATWKDQFRQFKDIAARVRKGGPITDADLQTLDNILETERAEPRLAVLKGRGEVLEGKRHVLALGRESDVYILERGSIEDYYPAYIQGRDKLAKAQEFCRRVTSADSVRRLCSAIHVPGRDQPVAELELIVASIFGHRLTDTA